MAKVKEVRVFENDVEKTIDEYTDKGYKFISHSYTPYIGSAFIPVNHTGDVDKVQMYYISLIFVK